MCVFLFDRCGADGPGREALYRRVVEPNRRDMRVRRGSCGSWRWAGLAIFGTATWLTGHGAFAQSQSDSYPMKNLLSQAAYLGACFPWAAGPRARVYVARALTLRCSGLCAGPSIRACTSPNWCGSLCLCCSSQPCLRVARKIIAYLAAQVLR